MIGGGLLIIFLACFHVARLFLERGGRRLSPLVPTAIGRVLVISSGFSSIGGGYFRALRN